MSERSEIIEWIRSEIVGPSRPLNEPAVISFVDGKFIDPLPGRRGPLAWRPYLGSDLQEVLYFDLESPHRKYGAGLLHPVSVLKPDEAALGSTDTIGAETEAEAEDAPEDVLTGDDVDTRLTGFADSDFSSDTWDDFEVTSPDPRHPSTIGISFCVRLHSDGRVVVKLPQSRHFSWQSDHGRPFPVNGRYSYCVRQWTDDSGHMKEAPTWRRFSAVPTSCEVVFERSEFVPGQVIRRDVQMSKDSPLTLCVEAFQRQLRGNDDVWLLTLILRNTTNVSLAREPRELVLYQSFFEVEAIGGSFEKYPESRRPFSQLDEEEQSLALLYREVSTWGIGHGCSAAWDAEPGEIPQTLWADVMPAVQLPSMTPDIEINGQTVRLSMRSLADLSENGDGPAWESLEHLASGYETWIRNSRLEANSLPPPLVSVADRHLAYCELCLERIRAGIDLLRSNTAIRKAFRLANLAMLLQQIVTKQLSRRNLGWDADRRFVAPQGSHVSPWDIYAGKQEDASRLGSWRAFQIAFLLMSLDGTSDHKSVDREIVDLIWFPTGGGKTEAYLGVMAFYMFHERLLMSEGGSTLPRDGTNIIMRYTLRMLTTQQFQRGASVICAMEYLRRYPKNHGIGPIPGKRFSVGLWVGSSGSPNTVSEARSQLADYRQGLMDGNPLVLTECPWCRSEIGRYEGTQPRKVGKSQWNLLRVRGVREDGSRHPLLHCPDPRCIFGQEYSQDWLPIEVIDERIYRYPPSLVIATADKLATIAYRPAAGALFGRRFEDGRLHLDCLPPGLIVQDELHLISGPLGTMYALYEGIIERLCSFQQSDEWIRPKLIASTATIRGASDQVKVLYARSKTRLFPSPGLFMSDSFFGRYARNHARKLSDGRLYLGIHASDYGSVLTTQVRAFSSALFRPFSLPEDRRDPWWTLVTFYNSIRELGGARTLFDSDIRSRLKFLFNRENYPSDHRRKLSIVDELTSRLSQAEIVAMMDRLSVPYSVQGSGSVVDVCLASSIIEVGVDIDRLSMMGVVGQPKSTASYIQVTGRVGRRWWERAGLILMIYNPSKSRDRSHFEQFHGYHRRLYERVEPTSATPFALSAMQRGLAGALIAWARQCKNDPVTNRVAYADPIQEAYELLSLRCSKVQLPEDQARSIAEMRRILAELELKWQQNPQAWEEFPQRTDGEYLMLWPGQFATALQKRRGISVPTSMRQVDRSAELNITQGYSAGAINLNPLPNGSGSDPSDPNYS